jgi:hypothetical protein
MYDLIKAIKQGFKEFGGHKTEEKTMYIMIDNVYTPVFNWEIVEEDDGTLNLRINGGDGSITE